jgi:hypothetical protein
MSLFYSLLGRVPDLLSLGDYCYGFIEEEGFCKIECLSYMIYIYIYMTSSYILQHVCELSVCGLL